MEIVIGIIIFGVVVVLRYWWATKSNETSEGTVTPTNLRYGLYSNTANNYPFTDPIQAVDDSGGSTDVPAPSSSDATSQQDCSPDSASGDRTADCPCPDNSTNYDSGGCSVDSSSPDVGNSN
jgi:hypothetical protein